MEKHNAFQQRGFFAILQTNRMTQTATMVLQPGQWSGERGNEHPKSEQILLVLEGEVVAEIGDDREVLRRGDAVVVPRGVDHRFGNESQAQATTFNVYAPPAY